MKKKHIAMVFAATVALISCKKEQSFEELTPLKEGDIAFVIKNTTTKSAGESSAVANGVTLPIKVSNEESFFLEESIEELNPAPFTKGAPAYTVNVGSLYPNMGVYAAGNFGDAAFELADEYEHKYDPKDTERVNGWRYRHNYADEPWPDENTPIDFYFRMPASPAGVSDLSYADKKTTFSFTSQPTAIEQQDILFSQTSVSKSQHDGYLPNGVPVLMYHALTGIKFRTGWANDTGTKTIITGVKFRGLKSKGTCTVDLGSENVVTWVPDASAASTSAVFYQDFNNPAYSAEAGVDGTVSYNKDSEHPENDKFGDSWYEAAADKNLNNEDGTWTFWFIPQVIDENVILEVSFRVKTSDTPEGTEITHTINFGEQLKAKNVEWKAGQLRTYTLKPLHVDVKVFDEMDASKYVKSNLHITNTGNVDQYVRVYIIGNWFGKRQINDGVYSDYESILMGYTDNEYDETKGDYVHYNEVARWNDKDFTLSGTTKVYPHWSSPSADYEYTPYGTFVGLPPMGTSTAPGASNGKNWIRHDKFYYYTQVIGPGGRVPETDPLFESYTINASPDFWIADMSGVRRLAKDVHFVMDVCVQAIPVPYNGDTAVGYEQAWKDAMGVDNINDL